VTGRRRAAGILAVVLLGGGAGGAGCGGDEEAAGERGTEERERPALVVSAAASLSGPLTSCSEAFRDARVRLSFAGSDELAGQIRQGVRPDVYAAANTELPEQLAREGLLREPVEFATNELVIAVTREDPRIGSVDDLARDGVSIAMGAGSVPVGAYARELLSRLGRGRREAILANVRSNEPDVRGVIGKLTQGAVDAGFVYRTDVTAAGDSLTAVALPRRLRPEARYGAAVVEGAREPRAAARFLDGLRAGRCAEALRAAGFGAAPP
jgi:molybdate transport system substrate-binding protein